MDRDLWADFFNKCVKTHAAKKFRKFKKKQEEAAASTAPNTVVTPKTVVTSKTVTTRPFAVTTQAKKMNTQVATTGAAPRKQVRFSPKSQATPTGTGMQTRSKTAAKNPVTKVQSTSTSRPVKKTLVANEISDVEEVVEMTEEEVNVLEVMEESGVFDETDGETEGEELGDSDLEDEE